MTNDSRLEFFKAKIFFVIESSKVVLALLSSSYINSKVCQEEYNLAFAMHRDTSYDTRLVPALIEDAGEVPVWCKSHTPLDCKNLTEEALKLIYDTVNTTIGKFYNSLWYQCDVIKILIS